jgi:hypothetical protein
MADTIDTVIGFTQFEAAVAQNRLLHVPSFGVRHTTACRNGCHPATLSVALGVNGETETPLMISFSPEQADVFIAWLQNELALARGEKAN